MCDNLSNNFKKIVLADICIFVLLMISYTIHYDNSAEIISAQGSPYDLLYIIGLIVLIFIYYLLLNLRQLGRTLYLPFIIISIIAVIFDSTDSTTYPGYVIALEWLSGLTVGAILALMYLTPLKDEFK